MAERLNKEEEDLFTRIIEEKHKSGVVLFGRYLALKGLISDEDIFNARMFQKGQNRMLGEIAIERGLLSVEDVNRLIVYQEESGIMFGELAVSLGYLSYDQLLELLGYADLSYIYFGEALVSIGVIKESVMKANLKLFQRLRLGAEGGIAYNA